MAQQRFTEFFPLLHPVPPLAAYRLQGPGADEAAGSRIAYRLAQALGSRWAWAEGVLLTDAPVSPVQIDITLDLLRAEMPDLLAGIDSAYEDADWGLTPLARAQYVLKTAVRDIEDDLIAAVSSRMTLYAGIRVVREPVCQPWQIGDEPALSISLRLRALQHASLHEWMQQRTEKIGHYIGWPVMDPTTLRMTGTIVGINGILAQHRSRLRALSRRPAMQQVLDASPDTTVIFRVRSGAYEYEYPATALHALLLPDEEERLRHIGLTPAEVRRALCLSPAARAADVKVLAEVFKARGIVGTSYNSRTHPDLFAQAEVLPEVRFADRRARALPARCSEWLRLGLYQRRTTTEPLTTALLTHIDDLLVSDFMEAMQRQLAKHGVELDVLRPQRLLSLEPAIVDGAARLMHRSRPALAITFVADEDAAHPALARLRAALQCDGCALLVITERELNDPDDMPALVTRLMSHTGTIPFLLAEPLNFADVVAGIHLERHLGDQCDRWTAVCRLFRADGLPLASAQAECEVDAGEPLPLIMLQTLLPTEHVTGQRVVIHLSAPVARGLRRTLRKWQALCQADVSLVEVLRGEAPALYGLNGQITHAGWGTVMVLNNREALLVTQRAAESAEPPLLVRAAGGSLNIDDAAYSVLVWTMLAYGDPSEGDLPATLRRSASQVAPLGSAAR